MTIAPVSIASANSKADRNAFIDLAYRINADDQNWVPPLRGEAMDLITPAKNPWFDHGKAQLFLARRGLRVVGRISAHFDTLALEQPAEQGMGPGTGNWGMLEAEDATVTAALIAQAEDWLREQGMTRVLAPLSLSVWDEPGLLTMGHDHPPTVMMGHDRAEYQAWVEGAGYSPAKQLYTYDLSIREGFPELVNRIVASGERSSKIRIRRVNKARFNEEAALILAILNDAWSSNWGFVPLTDAEIAHVGKKLKPIVYEDMIRIAEVDGEPVAFMMVLPDLNEKIAGFGGRLFPFNVFKLLWWMRKPQSRTVRVPLMGVVKRLQSSRMASQLAFMMIEYIRRDVVRDYSAQRGEIGWVLDDNQGMNAIAQAIGAKVNKVYTIYEKPL
ncbi:MAG: N-acetyltransferase [Pseudomonadota bacterium]|mgnify:CR=1 FL=1